MGTVGICTELAFGFAEQRWRMADVLSWLGTPSVRPKWNRPDRPRDPSALAFGPSTRSNGAARSGVGQRWLLEAAIRQAIRAWFRLPRPHPAARRLLAAALVRQSAYAG